MDSSEIEETTSPTSTGYKSDELAPLISSPTSHPKALTVRTKVPEVEVHLFRRDQGPIDVFKSSLGDWDQDELEVIDILEKYGFKSIYAFNSGSGRGVPVRFNPKTGRSLLPYTDGFIIFIDGEPKDSLIKPITKILVGVAVITLLIVLVMKETPQWVQKLNFTGGSFPPWILACVVIVFTRMRKRTRNFLSKHW